METSQLNSYWIQTYTGRQFFPFSPDPDQMEKFGGVYVLARSVEDAVRGLPKT